MAHFPADIVAEILSRLPVEPILRFRCVSKPWCALIDSPTFIKLHLKRSLENHENRNLVLEVPDSNENSRLYSVSTTMTEMIDSYSPLDAAAFKLNDRRRRSLELWGCCDGLILVGDRENDLVLIWNPSTKKHRKLPQPMTDDVVRTSPDHYRADFYGFGYDIVHDDYKVVKITQFSGNDIDLTTFPSQVKVYSLNTNSWTKVASDLPYYLSLNGSFGKFANGALHWAVRERPLGVDCCIVAFDLATMAYRIVPMPSIDDGEDSSMEVTSLEGRLCVFCNSEEDPCDVWVMEDYGVGDGEWTKLFSDDYLLNLVTPVALTKDGTKVLLLHEWTSFLWYDINHEVFQEVHIRGLQDIIRAEFCVQSLVPLPPNMVVVESGDKKKQKTEENKDKKAKSIGRKRMVKLNVQLMWNGVWNVIDRLYEYVPQENFKVKTLVLRDDQTTTLDALKKRVAWRMGLDMDKAPYIDLFHMRQGLEMWPAVNIDDDDDVTFLFETYEPTDTVRMFAEYDESGSSEFRGSIGNQSVNSEVDSVDLCMSKKSDEVYIDSGV